MKRILFTSMFFLVTLFICSCNDCTKSGVSKKTGWKKMPKIIYVYNFEGFDTALASSTIDSLSLVFDSIVVEGTIPFPDSAYYAPRNRYKADKLVWHLRGLLKSNKEIVVGFSAKDISDRIHGYDDYGIMGWTRHSLHSSVVSTYRLKNKVHINDDFYKLVLHELGHADGLPHCRYSETCIMSDANKKNRFSQTDGFCSSCKRYLKQRRWKLE